MNDNLRPERSQSFAYDKVSRLTSASGGFGDEGYGSISYGYNLGGDRTSRNWMQPANDGTGDMTLSEELYIYENATLRLTEVTANGSPFVSTAFCGLKTRAYYVLTRNNSTILGNLKAS